MNQSTVLVQPLNIKGLTVKGSQKNKRNSAKTTTNGLSKIFLKRKEDMDLRKFSVCPCAYLKQPDDGRVGNGEAIVDYDPDVVGFLKQGTVEMSRTGI